MPIVAKRSALKPVPEGPSRATTAARTAANGPAPKAPAHPLTPTHPTTRSHYATGNACARLPRVFFALLDGWLPSEPATDSMCVRLH